MHDGSVHLQDLLQSISDHEPDFVSLKRDAKTLCQGPANEQGLLSKNLEVRDSSAEFVAKQLDDIATVQSSQVQGVSPGQPVLPRPGQGELENTLLDYDRRLEEIKNKLKLYLTERETQLESARECDGLLDGMMSWLDTCEADMDALRVRDPSCAAIEKQQQTCQVLHCYPHTQAHKKGYPLHVHGCNCAQWAWCYISCLSYMCLVCLFLLPSYVQVCILLTELVC